MALRQKKRQRQGGFIVSAELALITTILVIGLIVGLVAVRDALVAELHDVAEAIGELDQSFRFQGVVDPATGAASAPSSFSDLPDNLGGTNPNIGNASVGGDDVGILFEAADDEEGEGFPTAPITP